MSYDDDYDCDDCEGCEDTPELATSSVCMANAVASSQSVKWYRLEVRSECDAEIPVAFTYVQAWDEKMAACMGDFFAAGYHVVSVDECASPLEDKSAARVVQLEAELLQTQKQAGGTLAAYSQRLTTVREGVFALNRGQAAQTQMLAQMLDAVK